MKTTVIFAALAILSLPLAQAQTGQDIAGHVIYNGEPFDAGVRAVTKDSEICGTGGSVVDESILIDTASGGLKNAVVYLADADAVAGWGSSLEATIDQAGCVFTPHIVILPLGEPLTVINSDGILHNFHTSIGKNRPVNLAMPKTLKTIVLPARRFRVPDFISIKCDVHAWMSAFIVVAEHPYYAITSDDGSFTLPDVPPGEYQLVVWHETLMGRTIPITVPAEDGPVLRIAIGERKTSDSTE